MDDSERRKQLEGIREAIQKGAFQPMGMNEAKRMLEKHLRGEKAKDDTVTLPRAEHEAMRKEYDNLRARVAELERERDRLALSLSATKAERDHAVRSAELLDDELHNSESARRDFEHAWLEGRAIMAVSMYFGRMRGPDAWLDHGSWDEYPELFACAGVDLRSFQHGTRFYAGSAPVPVVPQAAQADKGTCPACGTDIALTHAVNMLAAKAKGGGE